MDNSPRLGLSYVMAAQAQKHVTVNETFRRLDALVQMSVLSADVAVEPAAPAESDAYILPPGKTGATWDGFVDFAVAIFQDGAWMEIVPPDGAIAFVADAGRHKLRGVAGWADLSADLPEQLPRFGVNAAPDDTNRLTVKAEAELLSHDDVTPGSGDARKVINKATPGNTASILFQTGYSGRAEFGLTGADDFALKVSADGSQFTDALVFDRASGIGNFPAGLTLAGLSPVVTTDQSVILYVAPDIGNAEAGDYIGFDGLQAAIAALGGYIFAGDARGIIYLRDGVFAGAGPLRNNHPQAARVEIRALTAAASVNPDTDLVNNAALDEAALRGAYSAIVEITGGHGIDCYERAGFGLLSDILFIRTGGGGVQNGLNAAVEGVASLSACAFHGFYNGINISSRGSVTATNGLIITHSSSRSINTSLVGTAISAAGTATYPVVLASSASTGVLANIGSDVTLNGHVHIQHSGSFGAQVVGGASLRINGNTGQAVVRDNNGRAVYGLNDSAVRLSNTRFRNNSSYAVHLLRGCYGEVVDIDVDPAGTSVQQTVLAEDMSLVYESGTHQNAPLFSPAVGSEGNNGSRII